MTTDLILDAAYQRARAAHLPHSEALAEAQIAAAQIRADQARAQAAQADKENPQPAFSWARYDERERRATAYLDATFDPMQRQMRETRAAQIRDQIVALDKQIDAVLTPLRQRRQGLVEELGRL
jgi:uncharacterized protein YbaA (DUF1428 family)